jgi:D-3-phosphoglycerate dehydrogenase
MRLLIADKLHHRAIEELRTLPVDVLYEPEVTRETLDKHMSAVGILVVRSTEVTAAAIEAAKQLNLIVRAGAAFGSIDVRAASRKGIFVANCPGKNASAVAELVYGLMVSVDRRIPDAVASLRAGGWERAEFSKAEGLSGKTLGIAGFGAIGREVAARAKAFGLNAIAWSRSLTAAKAAEAGVGYAGSLDELASRSSILTMHLPLTDRTTKIVNKRVLSQLPAGSIFINTARADLVDADGLLEAVEQRKLRVAVDVYSDEPKGTAIYENRLLKARGLVYGTPHIAAATDQAQLSVATEAVRVIRSFLLEGTVPNIVNVSSAPSGRFQMIMRMADKVGTFANVLSVLKRHGINVEEVHNTTFEHSGAACAKLRIVTRPSEACISEIRAFEEVLHVDVITLPIFA